MKLLNTFLTNISLMMTFHLSIIKEPADFSILLAKEAKSLNFESIIITHHYQGNIFGVILNNFLSLT